MAIALFAFPLALLAAGLWLGIAVGHRRLAAAAIFVAALLLAPALFIGSGQPRDWLIEAEQPWLYEAYDFYADLGSDLTGFGGLLLLFSYAVPCLVVAAAAVAYRKGRRQAVVLIPFGFAPHLAVFGSGFVCHPDDVFCAPGLVGLLIGVVVAPIALIMAAALALPGAWPGTAGSRDQAWSELAPRVAPWVASAAAAALAFGALAGELAEVDRPPIRPIAGSSTSAPPTTAPRAPTAPVPAPDATPPEAAVDRTVSIPLTARLGEIAVGQCADFGADGSLVQRDCDSPHDGEMFARVSFAPPTEDYPGTPALTAFAEQRCPAAFDDYVGGQADGLGFIYFWPCDECWERGDDRIKCFALSMHGTKLEGSVRDAGRTG